MRDSERFGSYTVYECLGAGGMATVHRASIELEDDEIREVALKRLLPQYANDKRFVDDFIREAKLAAELQHPNIVRVLELGRIKGTYFIAMDLVRGRPLVSLMRKAFTKHASAPIGVVLALMTELLDALDHAHDAQIVHRDLTPSNLIVTDDGHLKIIDFGVAKALVGNLQTSSGLAKGKLGYMSSEAISGKQLDTRADIFSAGVVMWELLTTRRLFKGQNEYELIVQIREGLVAPPSHENPECPRELDDIVLQALAKSREDRWSSAGEMRDAIGELRRFYRASTQDVVRWAQRLRSDALRPEIESEGTEVQISTNDLFAEGSDMETYDEPVELPDEPDPEANRRRFLDSDTVITGESMVDERKR
ncbi:MAG TPA: serine/threonine-protein kinase [Kofleriaceae bacterium]|nr:serine/threonine-protein kinase [Kofleriaceae bacterium]